MEIEKILSQEFSLTPNHTHNIIMLIDEGCTIPFIARYRKELTGSCDDQVLRAFADRLTYLRNLAKRKEEIFFFRQCVKTKNSTNGIIFISERKNDREGL